MSRKLDPYTLRYMANAMLRTARQKRYVAVQHGPATYARGFSSGGASALEHEVAFCRDQARKASAIERRKAKPATPGKRKR